MCRVSQTSEGKSPPARPNVSVWFDQTLTGEQVILNIVLRNQGLASAEVESLVLWRHDSFKYEGLLSTFKYKGLLDLREPRRVDVQKGPTGFPFTIPSDRAVHMKLNVRGVEVFRHGKPFAVKSDYDSRKFFTKYGRLTAVLGNGAEVDFLRWWGTQFFDRERRLRDWGRS